MVRAAFLLRMLRQRFIGQNRDCPYCAQGNTLVIGTKRFVLQLRRCADCRLMFRWPKDKVEANRSFYQNRYRERIVTDVPNAASVEKANPSTFLTPETTLGPKIDLLRMLLPRGRVLDFGCSWGYGTFQLSSAGYDAFGFEISEPRARFGRMHLGLTVMSDEAELDRLAGSFDAVFASHVLEHIATPAVAFDWIAKMLKPGGVLLAFVPNCGGEEARRLGARWGPMCCEKHPLAFDADFFAGALPNHGFRTATIFSNHCSAENLNAMLQGTARRENLRGEELVIVARRSLLQDDVVVNCAG